MYAGKVLLACGGFYKTDVLHSFMFISRTANITQSENKCGECGWKILLRKCKRSVTIFLFYNFILIFHSTVMSTLRVW